MGAGQGAEDRAGGVGVAAEVDDLDQGLLETVGRQQEVEASGDAGGREAHRRLACRRARRRGGWPPRRGRPGPARGGCPAATRRGRWLARGSGRGLRARRPSRRPLAAIRSSSLRDVGGDPEQEAGIAPGPGDEPANGVGDGQGPGEAPDVAVGHQAGRHDGVDAAPRARRRSRGPPGRSASPRRCPPKTGRSGPEETPRSRSASTWRKLRPTPRCAPT